MFKRFEAGKHLSRAERFFARGQYNRARAEFDKAAELNPGDPAIHLRYAVFLSETNDPVAAVSHAERAVNARPNSAPYRLFYGRILFDHGRLKEARVQLNEARRLNPDSQLARNYAALVDIAEGRIEAGLDELVAADLSQNAGFHARALVLIETLVRLENGPPELKPLIVEEEPYKPGGLFRNWRARGLLSEGIHLLDVHKWDQAIRKFRRVRALSPGLVEARYQEGVAYFMAEDYSQAERIMAELVDLGDEPVLYLGAAMAEQGRFEEAIKILEKIVRPTPEYHYYLALYLLSVGRSAEARCHFELAAAKRHELLRRAFDRVCTLYGVKLRSLAG